jgi:Fe-S cluster assembly protein SufD
MTQLKEKINEPQWLLDKRRAANDSYKVASAPDRVSHLWKYTDPSIFLPELNGLKLGESKIELPLTEEALKKGVVLLEINSAMKEKSNLLANYFDRLASKELNKINLLNEALWSTGYFLYIPKGVKVEKPVVIKSSLPRDFEARRILIILEEGSSVNLIDENLSSDSEAFINTVSEIYLGKDSELTYLNINLNGKQTISHLFQRTSLGQNSKLTNLVVALGGKISKADIRYILNEESAASHTYGIVLGDDKQHFDHHTILDHQASFTKSSLNFRVALKDKARSAYTGNLKIIHEALKCSAIQENRNLLLSKDAKAESIPELEILTNDVERCSHGVTMGQVDKDQIYYLMSRGLSQKEAEKMVIEGFLEPTISRIPDEVLREEVKSRIEEKLKTL